MRPLLHIPYKKYGILFCCLGSMLFTACGIGNVVYLEKPRRIYDTSELDDLSRRYCEFNTADSANTTHAAGYFEGTEIYYRIYERESDCINDRATIFQYNDKNPSSAAQYLQTTKKYYPLTTSSVTRRPLIGTFGSNVTVRFRLQDYGGTTDPAQLVANGSSLGVPYRSGNILLSKRGFTRQNIAVEDEDVQRSSSSNTDAFWWVNFYAVSYGYDAAFRTLYSSLEPLGAIKLEKNP